MAKNETKSLVVLDAAVALHDATCHWNHADGCGWFYEVKDNVHDWSGQAHRRYIERVIKMIDEGGVTANEIFRVMSAYKSERI